MDEFMNQPDSLVDQDFDALLFYTRMITCSRGRTAQSLTRSFVLRDLKVGGLAFTSIELIGQDVRIYGETAIVTRESRTLARRDGKQLASRFLLVAVYTSQAEMLRLVHFQSTALPTEPRLGC
jgi:hypothetical protein